MAITGAGDGAGKATAEVLATHGARVALGDLRYVRAERVASAINHTVTPQGGGVAIALRLDVRDPESVRRFLDEVRHDFGPLDVLVSDTPDAAREGMRLAVPEMARRGTGHVINIATDAAAGTLTDSARREFGASGVRFTAIVPREEPPAAPDDVASAVCRSLRSRRRIVRVRARARTGGARAG